LSIISSITITEEARGPESREVTRYSIFRLVVADSTSLFTIVLFMLVPIRQSAITDHPRVIGLPSSQGVPITRTYAYRNRIL
jgi:hypothetical protein